ncbi:hypothetical protein A1232T_00875 [Psychrobacter piechaudii]|uniref:Type IV secretion protein Rhs n=2 Tax=Psychrobacter piechaudii TaxID=1945521 RepID=A0A1R4GQ33_9GAMM|nr:hypothetical protein A1232T_00875 [Psychrobacter piechaudii]
MRSQLKKKLKKQLKKLPKPMGRLSAKALAVPTTQQKSRPLTEAEIKMAHSVFGPDFDVSQVRLKTAWWVLKNYAVSPNGNIYFNPKDWVEDFSKQSLGKKSWLIHELTHVWQLQQGLKVVSGAMRNRRYDYILQEGKPFFTYGIEQQARMVQDYFVRREQGKDCGAWQACIPFLQQHPDYKNKDNNNKEYQA